VSLKEEHLKLNIRNAIEGSSSRSFLIVSAHNAKTIPHIHLHTKEERFQHLSEITEACVFIF
jgi:hypothetical protein